MEGLRDWYATVPALRLTVDRLPHDSKGDNELEQGELDARHAVLRLELAHRCADARMRSYELKRPFQFFRECVGSFGAVSDPPFSGLSNRAGGGIDNVNRKASGHYAEIRSSISDAPITFPASASAIAASKRAYSSGVASKTSPFSGARMVTVVPSGRRSSSISIRPPFTLPVVISIT